MRLSIVHICFFLDCITATDCPYGGTNFLCNANTCECQSPNILVGDKCVGKLMLSNENKE